MSCGYERKNRKKKVNTADKYLKHFECTGPNNIKPAHMHTFSPIFVLFMCFYVFTFVITRAFGSAGAPGDRKRRQTQFDVFEFSPIRELKTGNKRKGEP